MPVLDEGTAWGGRLRADFPFSGFARHNPVVGIEDVGGTGPDVGARTQHHVDSRPVIRAALEENLAVADTELDDQELRQLTADS